MNKKLHTGNRFVPLCSYISSRKWIIAYALAYTVIILLVTLNRFWQFEVFYYDQGLFDSAIYNVAHFRPPIIEHQTLGIVHQFADHVVPSLYIVFSPVYWVTNRYDATIILLAIYTGFSVLVAYEIGTKLVRSQVVVWALIVSYTWYVGLQNALIFYIHDITAMSLPLMLLFYVLLRGWWIPFYLLLALTLGFKETISVLTLSIGAWMVVSKREWRIHGIFVIVLSVAYGYLASRVIIPYFSHGKFLYSPIWPQSIFDAIHLLIDVPSKRQLILWSLATFGFLPLLSPLFLIVPFQDLFLRFVLQPGPSQRLDLGLHYNATLATLLFIGAVYGAKFLFERVRKVPRYIEWGIGIGIVGIVFSIHQFLYHGPFGLVYNPEFYHHTGRQQFMHAFIQAIPRTGTILVQNNIATFFVHEPGLRILARVDQISQIAPDVVALDIRPGQNPSNLWPMDEKSARTIVSALQNNTAYTTVYHVGDQFVFVKKKDL